MDLKDVDVTKAVKDAAYIALGFGVLAWQKTQVRRREIEKQFEGQTTELRAQLAKVAAEVDERIEPVVQAVETSLDQIEERLPNQARDAFKAARTAAKEAGAAVRSRFAADDAGTSAAA